MGTGYEQLTLAERIELYRLHEQGESMRAIAKRWGAPRAR
jgi:IS30 family transposase